MTFIKAIRPSPLLDVVGAVRHVLQTPDLMLFPTDRLEDLPGWDSMRHIALIAEIESRCRIQFGPDEIEGVTTLADLTGIVAMKRDAG